MELFDFIDNVQTEMGEIQRCFFNEWNTQIRRYFSLPDDFSIESYIDVFGGYRLSDAQYQKLDDELKHFYQQRIIRQNGSYHLRGYDYYSVDPLIHLQKNRKDPQQFWSVLQKKLQSYESAYTFSFLTCQPVSFVNWIGTLGFLEYMFSDLTSLMWFIYRNHEHLVFKMANSEYALNSRLRKSVEIIGESLAALLFFDCQHAQQLLQTNIHQIIPLDLSAYLDLSNCKVENWNALRSIREGDSLVLIYAAYLIKLSPCLKAQHLKKILLLSNCFGAMNIGSIIKPLLSYEHEVNCVSYNVLYAQNRAEEDAIYEGDYSRSCYIMDDNTLRAADGVQAVFVIDDSIFSGKSFHEIKMHLQKCVVDSSCGIYLLPLTLNCDCIKYCRRGIRPDDDMNQIAVQVVNWARQTGNTLPPFTSFWDFCRQAYENMICTECNEVRTVLRGDDLLMKHLWAKFEYNIVSEQVN